MAAKDVVTLDRPSPELLALTFLAETLTVCIFGGFYSSFVIKRRKLVASKVSAARRRNKKPMRATGKSANSNSATSHASAHSGHTSADTIARTFANKSHAATSSGNEKK